MSKTITAKSQAKEIFRTLVDDAKACYPDELKNSFIQYVEAEFEAYHDHRLEAIVRKLKEIVDRNKGVNDEITQAITQEYKAIINIINDNR